MAEEQPTELTAEIAAELFGKPRSEPESTPTNEAAGAAGDLGRQGSERTLPELTGAEFAPIDLNEPQVVAEPPIPNLPPRDKPVAEWTKEESAADMQAYLRTLARVQRRQAAEEAAREAEIQREAGLTPDQRHGLAIGQALAPAAKRAAHERFMRQIHPGDHSTDV
jgi:hypothetical protein